MIDLPILSASPPAVDTPIETCHAASRWVGGRCYCHCQRCVYLQDSETAGKVTHVIDEESLYEEKNACDVVEREEVSHWCYPC